MSKYFTIAQGLRGGYMPDSCYTVRVDSRKELKAILNGEAESVRDMESTVGCSKRAIAWLANVAWKEAQKKDSRAYLPYVAPWGYRNQISQYPYGIFVSLSTRAEFLENQDSE